MLFIKAKKGKEQFFRCWVILSPPGWVVDALMYNPIPPKYMKSSFKNCILNLLRLALSNMTKQNRNNKQTNQEGQILFHSTLHLYSVARCLRASLLRKPDITSCPHQRNLQFFTHSRGACSVLFWVTWLRSRENTGAFVVLCPWTWALKLFVFAHFLGA